MSLLRKHVSLLLQTAFLVFVFCLSQLPLKDFDIWFHLKSGEVFVKAGHPFFTDVFSYSAYGREWIPYEWLFQVIVYLLSTIGLWIIPPFIGLFAVIFYSLFMQTLRKFFKVNIFYTLCTTFMLFVSIYEYFFARPYVIGYTFVVLLIFLIFEKIFHKKNWVFITPLLTLIWTNIHSTAFLSWGLLLSFGIVVLVQKIILQRFSSKKNEILLRQLADQNDTVARDLFILAGINFLMTITPPLWFRDYKLLWNFYKDSKFLGQFIAEWQPTTQDTYALTIYSLTTALSLLSFFFATWRKRAWVENLWALPIILIILVGFSASRNLALGNFGLFLLFGYGISTLSSLYKNKIVQLGIIGLILGMVGFYIFQFTQKSYGISTQRYYYPVTASQFAKAYLSGNMFNEYEYGGYLLYTLYPKLKVYIDGRTDIYRCCEMREYLSLSTHKMLPDNKYRTFLNNFLNKHEVSFVMLSVRKHDVMRRIEKLLDTDSKWVLVYWDDTDQIFVRKDGKNEAVIRQFGVLYATPYLRDPYIKNHEKEALLEYERMDKVAKSAHTSNAIGFLLLQQKSLEDAKQKFLEAVKEDPTFESPYMNLGELAAYDGNLAEAINLYKQAQILAPDRGLIYIRLGQLMLQNGSPVGEVREVWKEGVKNTVDDDAKKRLQELLSQ